MYSAKWFYDCALPSYLAWLYAKVAYLYNYQTKQKNMMQIFYQSVNTFLSLSNADFGQHYQSLVTLKIWR